MVALECPRRRIGAGTALPCSNSNAPATGGRRWLTCEGWLSRHWAMITAVTKRERTDMAQGSLTMDAGACLVSEEMAQYFLTVDGQPGTYILGDASASSVRAPHVDRNRIFRARLGADTADQGIERLLLPFRHAAVPVTWYVDSCSRPNDLATRLASHGLELRYFWTGMTCALDGSVGAKVAPSDI